MPVPTASWHSQLALVCATLHSPVSGSTSSSEVLRLLPSLSLSLLGSAAALIVPTDRAFAAPASPPPAGLSVTHHRQPSPLGSLLLSCSVSGKRVRKGTSGLN